jgi:shikimate dehydrogenase
MPTPRSFQQELTSVFGQPVAENPTQAMLEAAYRHHGLDWRYLTIEVAPEQLGDAVRGFRAMNFRGGNLTIPHKVAVIEHLDGLSPAAEKIGAVNCMVWKGAGEDRRLIGENTDGKGFVESLSEVLDPTGRNVVIFGSGGAARAIGVELALAGAEAFTIVNRNEQRGLDLAKRLRDKTPAKAEYVHWKSNYALPEATDVVVNATSIGLFPHVDARLDFDLDTLTSNMIVADVIPNPPTTRLVKDARDRGCTVLDGLGMLVNQGVIGVRLWSGIDPDRGVMRAALEEVFGG